MAELVINTYTSDMAKKTDISSENVFLREVGQRIRDIRKSKVPKMSSEKLAELAGLTYVTINNIENGKLPKVSLATIMSIAAALSVPVSYLVGESDLVKEALKSLDLIKKVLQEDEERLKSVTKVHKKPSK